MALLRYLQVLPHGQLPDPKGPLSSSLPLPVIEEANAAVTSARRQDEATEVKRGPYMKPSRELTVAVNTALLLHTSLAHLDRAA